MKSGKGRGERRQGEGTGEMEKERTLFMLERRWVYSSRISCSRGERESGLLVEVGGAEAEVEVDVEGVAAMVGVVGTWCFWFGCGSVWEKEFCDI